MDFSLSSWTFWFILFFDVLLLICEWCYTLRKLHTTNNTLQIIHIQLTTSGRDADLWEDLAIWLGKKFGWVGTSFFACMQLLSGHTDTLGDTLVNRAGTGGLASGTAPTEQQKRKQRRELTENCGECHRDHSPSRSSMTLPFALLLPPVVSEMLSSMVLFVLVGTDMILHRAGMDGNATVTSGLTQAQRANALQVYFVILVCQVLGICISHRIIRHKNEISEKLIWLQHRSRTGPMPMPSGMKWHFFLSQ